MQLVRTLRLRDLVLLIIGTVIGSGIFLVPGGVLRNVQGRTALAMAAWVAGGIISLMGALTYGELTAMEPNAGGLYSYIRTAFGRFPAFLFGWAMFLVIASGAIATLAAAFPRYLSRIVPLTPIEAKLVSIGMIAVVAFINVRGARTSADVQNWATGVKVAAILVMTVILLWLGRGHAPAAQAPTEFFAGPLASGFLLAMVSVLWAYEGWQYSTFSAAETANPQRDFPRAYLIASLALIFIYVLANLGYLAALGSAGAARSTSVASEAIGGVLGAGAGRLIALAILVSIFSAANGTTLSATRVFYAMAQDGVFFRKLAEVHPRYRTPAVAIIAGLGWAMLLVATGTFEQLLTYVVFTGWAFYALGAASIFVYRRKFPHRERPYRVPGYPLTPLLFIIPSLAIVINTIFAAPKQAAVGIVIVLAGAPAYFVWRRNARTKAAQSATSE